MFCVETNARLNLGHTFRTRAGRTDGRRQAEVNFKQMRKTLVRRAQNITFIYYKLYWRAHYGTPQPNADVDVDNDTLIEEEKRTQQQQPRVLNHGKQRQPR